MDERSTTLVENATLSFNKGMPEDILPRALDVGLS